MRTRGACRCRALVHAPTAAAARGLPSPPVCRAAGTCTLEAVTCTCNPLLPLPLLLLPHPTGWRQSSLSLLTHSTLQTVIVLLEMNAATSNSNFVFNPDDDDDNGDDFAFQIDLSTQEAQDQTLKDISQFLEINEHRIGLCKVVLTLAQNGRLPPQTLEERIESLEDRLLLRKMLKDTMSAFSLVIRALSEAAEAKETDSDNVGTHASSSSSCPPCPPPRQSAQQPARAAMVVMISGSGAPVREEPSAVVEVSRPSREPPHWHQQQQQQQQWRGEQSMGNVSLAELAHHLGSMESAGSDGSEEAMMRRSDVGRPADSS